MSNRTIKLMIDIDGDELLFEAWDSIGLYQKKVIEYAEKGFENNPKDWNHILFQNISLGCIKKNFLQKKEDVLGLMDFAGNHNEKYFNADDIIKFIKHPMFLCKLGKELSYDWDIIVRYIRFNGNWINSEYIPEELRNDIKFLHWVIRWNTRSWSSLPKNTIPEQEQDPI
ncbi:MAG: hypothetical protein U9O56_03480 [Campylobacterota bacterium]|nr:hypothetical protein [Campylobacterota bacterium]